MNYDIKTHRKKFSLWAACRAVQVQGEKGRKEELIQALEKSGVIEFLEKGSNFHIDEDSYFELHDNWVNSICNYMKKEFHINISYGRAAKLIAVFVKSCFILDGKEDTELARVAHPPVDSIMLKGLDKIHKTNLFDRYKWKKLKKKEYRNLLNELKEINGSDSFWKIERYWNPED